MRKKVLAIALMLVLLLTTSAGTGSVAMPNAVVADEEDPAIEAAKKTLQDVSDELGWGAAPVVLGGIYDVFRYGVFIEAPIPEQNHGYVGIAINDSEIVPPVESFPCMGWNSYFPYDSYETILFYKYQGGRVEGDFLFFWICGRLLIEVFSSKYLEQNYPDTYPKIDEIAEIVHQAALANHLYDYCEPEEEEEELEPISRTLTDEWGVSYIFTTDPEHDKLEYKMKSIGGSVIASGSIDVDVTHFTRYVDQLLGVGEVCAYLIYLDNTGNLNYYIFAHWYWYPPGKQHIWQSGTIVGANNLSFVYADEIRIDEVRSYGFKVHWRDEKGYGWMVWIDMWHGIRWDWGKEATGESPTSAAMWVQDWMWYRYKLVADTTTSDIDYTIINPLTEKVEKSGSISGDTVHFALNALNARNLAVAGANACFVIYLDIYDDLNFVVLSHGAAYPGFQPTDSIYHQGQLASSSELNKLRINEISLELAGSHSATAHWVDSQGEWQEETIIYWSEPEEPEIKSDIDIVKVTQAPQEPEAGENVTVTAHITDKRADITSVTLSYGSASLEMSRISGTSRDGYWQAIIPGQRAGITLWVKVTARDSADNRASSPAHSKQWSEILPDGELDHIVIEAILDDTRIRDAEVVLRMGDKVNFVAHGYDAAGKEISLKDRELTWEVEPDTLGDIDQNGDFEARELGWGFVTCRDEDSGIFDDLRVRVVEDPPITIHGRIRFFKQDWDKGLFEPNRKMIKEEEVAPPVPGAEMEYLVVGMDSQGQQVLTSYFYPTSTDGQGKFMFQVPSRIKYNGKIIEVRQVYVTMNPWKAKPPPGYGVWDFRWLKAKGQQAGNYLIDAHPGDRVEMEGECVCARWPRKEPKIYGRVKDKQGTAVEGAEIGLYREEPTGELATEPSMKTLTKSDGSYELSTDGLPPGRYRLKASKKPDEKQHVTLHNWLIGDREVDIELPLDKDKEVNFTMTTWGDKVGYEEPTGMVLSAQDEAQGWCENGVALYQQGLYDGAMDIFNMVLTTYPESDAADNARYYLGKCYSRLGLYDEAAFEFYQVAAGSPDSDLANDVFTALSGNLYQQSYYWTALGVYEWLLRDYPESKHAAYAQTCVGKLYVTLGDVERGKAELQEVIANYPDSAYVEYAEDALEELSPEGDQPPDEPSEPLPADSTTNVSIPASLSVLVSDPDDDAVTVTFYDASDDSIIGTNTVVSGCRAELDWPGLEPGAGYSWYGKACDGKLVTASDTWSFTTAEEWDPMVYDENKNGEIDKMEAIQAVMDYFDGEINKAKAIDVIMLYFG